MNFYLLIIKTLMPPERADKKRRRIACIGDSITFGAGVIRTRKTDAWTSLWGKRLGKGFQVLNYGVSGATLQREGDSPYRKVGYLKRLEKAQPELMLLMLGTNDAKPFNWDEGRYAREYEELVRELRDKPWPHRLVLMAPPKAFPEEQSGVIPFDIQNDPSTSATGCIRTRWETASSRSIFSGRSRLTERKRFPVKEDTKNARLVLSGKLAGKTRRAVSFMLNSPSNAVYIADPTDGRLIGQLPVRRHIVFL